MKVVMYCRVAHDNHEELETQIKCLNDFALAQGHSVQETISDVANGISDPRPGLQKLKSVVNAGGVNAVLVDGISRLHRSTLANLDFKRLLEAKGVRLLSRTEDNLDEVDDMMKAIVTEFKKTRSTVKK